MKKLALALGALVFVSTAQAASNRCAQPAADEANVYRNDFDWNLSLAQALQRFNFIYPSGKRLRSRAYYDAEAKRVVFPMAAGRAAVDPVFIQSVTRHIEQALERGYAETVIFPDMGHAHFFVPKEEWPKIEPLGMDSPASIVQMTAMRGLKLLYHTAEQIELKIGEGDAWVQWRYYTRNLVGDNQGGENLYVVVNKGGGYNTVRELPGYTATATSINISASAEGCFPYRQAGETRYFDISLESLPALPVADRDGDDFIGM